MSENQKYILVIDSGGTGIRAMLFNKEGEIVVDRNNHTKTSGLFAAGDITDVKYEQIVIAASEGAKATLEANEHLGGITRK